MSESYIPTEQLIRSGELAGRAALEYLKQTNAYVFHGTPIALEQLEPRQAINNGQADGPPAVAATTNIDQAIFRALINRINDQSAGVNHHYSAWTGTERTMSYLALSDSLDNLTEEQVGYVYAMAISDNNFLPFRKEMRSTQRVQPDFKVEVHKSDLPDVTTFQSSDELKSYLKHNREGIDLVNEG